MVLIAGEAGIPENTVNLTYLWILRGKFGGLSRFESALALFSPFAKNLVAGPAFVFEHLVRDPGLIFGHDHCGSSIPDKLRACQHALDTKELADILQVSKIWILRKVKNRTIPHFKDGKILRFDPRLIADWWDKKSKR